LELGNERIVLDDLIANYHRPIYKYCYHMLRHQQEAEDAAQEVFVKAIRFVQRGGQVQSTSPWLYRIAHLHCLNVIKRKKLLRFIPFLPDIKTDEAMRHDMSDTDLTHTAQKLLDLLSTQDRSILLLRIVEQKSYEEIGAIIDAKPATVRKRFERAKRKIRSVIEAQKEGGHAENEANSISFI